MEYWDSYTADGERDGRVLVRGQPIPRGQYHLVASVTIRHADGSYLLLRRAPEKEVYPNWLEIGASGSALQGEGSLQCAWREMAEETGICQGEMTFLYRTTTEDTHFDGFLCQTSVPKDSVCLQPGETVEYLWLEEEAFLRFVHSPSCIPEIRARLDRFLTALTQRHAAGHQGERV